MEFVWFSLCKDTHASICSFSLYKLLGADTAPTGTIIGTKSNDNMTQHCFTPFYLTNQIWFKKIY